MHSGPGGLRRQPAMATTAQRGEQGHPSKSALHALRHKVCWLLCWNSATSRGPPVTTPQQGGESEAEHFMQVLPSSEEFNPSAYLGFIHAVGQMCALPCCGSNQQKRRQKSTSGTFANHLVPTPCFLCLQDTPVDELQMGRLNLKKDLSERTGQLKSLVSGSWVVF